MTFEDYKHSIPVQVRFVDIDRLNHVNNAVYLNYCEMGRIHYFNSVLTTEIDWIETGLIMARTEVDYKRPVVLKDEVYCASKITKLGNKSIVMQSSVFIRENNVYIECAAIVVTLVAMNYKINASITIPESWRKRISEFEGIS